MKQSKLETVDILDRAWMECPGKINIDVRIYIYEKKLDRNKASRVYANPVIYMTYNV